jgi:hypothetical protein
MPTAVASERWTSDTNQREIHFFVAGDQNTYILGYNPELIPTLAITAFLRSYGFEVPA